MSDHVNQLTPAQAERLAMLAEECAELAASSTVPAQTAMRLAAAIRTRGEGQP